jgi:signal-transduction protein with cAMP-binding, CBS, and nucleotidyltransferase domain
MICPNCGHNNLPGSEQCDNCLNDLTQLDQPVAHDRIERSLMEDPIRTTLHPAPPVTLLPTATVAEAIQTMLARNIGAILVADAAGEVIGVFSERDLLTKVAGLVPDYTERPISEFMTPDPETVRPSDTLAFVLHKMDSGGYRHLPVLEGGKAIGMISVRDMLRHVTSMCRA